MPASIRKSGSNVYLNLTGETYDDSYCGSREDVGAAQVALQTTTQPCFQVMLQASPANNDYVAVGNLAQGCHIRLVPGAMVTIPIDDVNKVFVRAGSGTQAVFWMAMI